MANIKSIPMAFIKANPLNLYKDGDDKEQIEVLADSIKEIGLTQPLVVYENGTNEYVIMGGHKRFEALKLAGFKGMSDIPCVIQRKPIDEIEEREKLLQNNISRKSPEELERQILEAHNLWNTMSSDKRAFYTEKYRNEFIKKFGDDPRNIDQNFRARLDYIRALTGLTTSNRTVTSIIKRQLDKTSEAFPTVLKDPKPITIRDIVKKATALIGLIDLCEEEVSQSEANAIRDAELSLRELVEAFD